jgi:adenylate cyclase
MVAGQQEMRGMWGLWQEVRRRNLHRVSAAYAVVAWVLVQAASIVFPTFGMPGWTLRLLIILLFIGLPVIWAVLWHAIPLVERDADEGAPAGRLRHSEVVLISLLGLVLLATLAEFILPRLQTNGAAQVPHADAQDPSIAVLAFNNMSEERNNQYFSEGISEELLNDLTQVRGLRVAARTSSFSFQGKSVTIGEIGRTLHVRTVLEGSVRREGNRVRITAQLISAKDGYHIWSQTYDREIADIFAVQDEISRAITRELTGRLLGRTQAQKYQINPAVYTTYLQGRFFLNKRNRADMQRAKSYFEQALALDADYVDARASLALTDALLVSNGQDRKNLARAKREADAALRQTPDNFDALVSSALVAQASWEWTTAQSIYKRLLAHYPNTAEARHFSGAFFENLQLPERWLAEHERAEVLDPLSPLDRGNIGEALHMLGRDEDAIPEYQGALTLDPNMAFSLSGLCAAYANAGRLSEARTILNDRLVAADSVRGFYTVQCSASIANREADARTKLLSIARDAERGYAEGSVNPGLVGLIYAFAGDFGAALNWFQKAINEHDLRFFQNTAEPGMQALKSDPRWQSFMQQPALQEWTRIRQDVIARGDN